MLESMPRKSAEERLGYDFGTGGSGRLGGGPGHGGRLIMTGIIVMEALPALTCTGAVAILKIGQATLARCSLLGEISGGMLGQSRMRSVCQGEIAGSNSECAVVGGG